MGSWDWGSKAREEFYFTLGRELSPRKFARE